MEDSLIWPVRRSSWDRVMHRIGLHGKSFIPAHHGIRLQRPRDHGVAYHRESRSSRLITILITPFMSCSARIPIYLLLTGTFLGCERRIGDAGALRAGHRVGLSSRRADAAVSLPGGRNAVRDGTSAYRLPTFGKRPSRTCGTSARNTQKMGGMIPDRLGDRLFLSYAPARTRLPEPRPTTQTLSGTFGRGCEPVFSPLGFNWKASVALLSGLPAKETWSRTPLGVFLPEGAVTTPAEGEIRRTARPEIVVAELRRKNPPESAAAAGESG